MRMRYYKLHIDIDIDIDIAADDDIERRWKSRGVLASVDTKVRPRCFREQHHGG